MTQDVGTRADDTHSLDRAAGTEHDPDNERFDQLAGEPLGRDLLKHRVVSAVMRSRWYPGVLQIPIAAVFGLVAYQLLAGPTKAHENAGTALMWGCGGRSSRWCMCSLGGSGAQFVRSRRCPIWSRSWSAPTARHLPF